MYQSELYKACFPHNMVYGDFKDLPSRTISDKILCDRACNIEKKKNLKYDRYQYGLASMACKLFDKKDSDGNTAGGTAKSKIMPNQKLAKKLCKTIMRKFK